METQTPHWRRIAAPAAFALLCLVLSFLTYARFGGTLPLQPAGYRVDVPLPSALALPVGADVQMAGVRIGKVAAVRRAGAHAVATLQLRPAFAPLRAGARAIVRTKTLLGEGYVELAPGPRDAPLIREGGSLAASHVQPTVALDQFLQTFDAPTRRRFHALFAGLATAYADRGRQLNDTLGYAEPLTNDFSTVLDVLDAQRADLHRLLAGTGDVLAAAGSRPGTLRAAIRAGDAVLSTTARRDSELAATIRALPGFERSLHATADTISSASGDLDRAVGSLDAIAPRVAPALRDVSATAPQFTQLFRRLPATITAGRAGLPALGTIVAALPSGFDGLYPASRELIPLMQLLARYAEAAVVGTLSNSGALTNGKLVGPGGKIVSRAAGAVTVTNESLAGWIRKLPTNRSNPYPKPLGFRSMGTQGYLNAYDCRHIGNPLYLPPLGTGEPPCHVQGPWTFAGRTAFYPRLRLAPP